MYAVNDLGGYLHCALITEGHFRSPHIVIYRFGKRHNVQPLLMKKVCGLMGAVSSEDHKTVKSHLLVMILHILYLIHTVFINDTHHLKRLPACSEYSPSQSEDARKIRWLHKLILTVDQALISVTDTINFNISGHLLIKSLGSAADSCIKSLAVSAAGQDPNLHHSCLTPY